MIRAKIEITNGDARHSIGTLEVWRDGVLRPGEIGGEYTYSYRYALETERWETGSVKHQRSNGVFALLRAVLNDKEQR